MIVQQNKGVYDKQVFQANTSFDLEDVLPLELIREHTKTDDVPSVSDSLLKMYRKAALSAAQRYTGLFLMGKEIIREDVRTPIWTSHKRETFYHRTEYPFAENVAYYYGLKHGRAKQIHVDVGSRVVELRRDHDDFGLGCCNPDGTAPLSMLQYAAGFDCPDSIPVEIQMGALKYIAHVIENPGDNVVASYSSGATASTVGTAESSSPIVASGAMELWRTCIPDAI